MKAVFVAVALLAVTCLARAQTAPGPVSRADFTGTLGWLSADKGELNSASYANDWYNRSVYAGAGFGWYWTDHWKTEIEAGISSSAELNVYTSAVIDRRPTTVNSTYEFGTRRLAIGQHYQFFRNAWFHPFAGAGLDLTWEQIDQTDDVFAPQPAAVRVPTPAPDGVCRSSVHDIRLQGLRQSTNVFPDRPQGCVRQRRGRNARAFRARGGFLNRRQKTGARRRAGD